MGASFQRGRDRAALGMAGALALVACSQKPAPKPATPQSGMQVEPAPVVKVSDTPPPQVKGTAVETEVPLEASGGTFLVPVSINDTIILKFTIDSGAADVSIPADVASTLVRAGTITKDDFIGQQTFVMADGTTVPSPEFRIRTLKVGTLVLHDVTGSLSNAQGELLLGQSFLKRLTSWSVDNQRHVLMLKAADAEVGSPVPNSPAAQLASSEPAGDAATPSDQASSVTTAPATQPTPLSASALEVARAYLTAWSDPADPDGNGIRRFYASTITYYGRPTTVDAVMLEKRAFAHRWPVRSYVPRDGSWAVSCSNDDACTVSAVVDWQAENTAAGRHSTGAATFAMSLQGGQITSETGAVISRDR